ncbi:hypothetical protein HD806DRAFT_477573 [Xylariaceae sp. AK1471]|nr:hypothetical protein HD806DRAFT_477573 [Xylariaceae sp. AK1471]
MPPLPPPHRGAPPRPLFPISISESLHTLNRRLLVGADTVPQGYGNAPFGPDAGTVVGITLGSVGGFLLLLGIIYWCMNLGQGPRMVETGSVGGGNSSVVSRHSRARGHPHRHHRRSKRETVEIRRERAVPVTVEREEHDQIIVEEYRPGSRGVSRPPPPPRTPPPRTPPPRAVYSDEDEIIVIQDPEPPRRRRDSVRSHRTRRSDDRRSSYRDEIYVRDLSRQRSRSRG